MGHHDSCHSPWWLWHDKWDDWCSSDCHGWNKWCIHLDEDQGRVHKVSVYPEVYREIVGGPHTDTQLLGSRSASTRTTNTTTWSLATMKTAFAIPKRWMSASSKRRLWLCELPHEIWTLRLAAQVPLFEHMCLHQCGACFFRAFQFDKVVQRAYVLHHLSVSINHIAYVFLHCIVLISVLMNFDVDWFVISDALFSVFCCNL